MKKVLDPKKKKLWGLENYIALKKACYKLFWTNEETDSKFGHIQFRKIPEIAEHDRILENFIEI